MEKFIFYKILLNIAITITWIVLGLLRSNRFVFPHVFSETFLRGALRRQTKKYNNNNYYYYDNNCNDNKVICTSLYHVVQKKHLNMHHILVNSIFCNYP